MHSTSESRSPSCSAAIRVEIRSSPGVVPALLDQRARPLVELRAGALDRVALVHQAGRVELTLDQVRPLVQLGRVVERRAHHGRDRERGVGLGQLADELAAAPPLERRPEALEELAHRRPPAVGGARGEGRVHEVAQPPVRLAVDVKDVAPHLLEQRALRHLEHLRDPHAGKGRALGAQEEGRGLAVEHDEADRRARDPAPLAQLAHGLVEALALEVRAEVVELRSFDFRNERHLTPDTNLDGDELPLPP